MSSWIEKTILKTLAYSDIFDYPLTKEELWKYLITSKPISRRLFESSIKSLDKIDKIGIWYFLKGRSSIVKTRIRREEESKKKIKIANRLARILSKIPAIQFIGISGALAMNNSDIHDDIDFFIITSEKSLWMTRLFVLLALELLGLRRKRKDMRVSDTICLNMIITEDALFLPFIKKDLYTAHEVVQIKTLFDRRNVYRKFLDSNRWVGRYLPNSTRGTNRSIHTSNPESFVGIFLRFVLSSQMLEQVARTFQMFSIQRHRTTEIISDVILAFHPFDYGEKILSAYDKRIKEII